MRSRSFSHSALLFIATALLVLISWGSSVVAQPPFSQKFRKIYVPEDRPASWPEGDWQPISSQKLSQLLEAQNTQSKPFSSQGMNKAVYTATFKNGQFIHGKLVGEVSNPEKNSLWKNLGKTNIPFHSLQWKQGKTSWGTNLASDNYIFQQPNQKVVQGEWSLDGRSHSKATHFVFKLLKATQSTLKLVLPASMQLRVTENLNLPVFASDVSKDSREWTVHLSGQPSITISVQPIESTEKKSQLLTRHIHLLNIGVSEQRFITEFQVEQQTQQPTNLQLFLPQGYQTEQIEIDQKVLSNWKSIPSKQENKPGVFIPIHLQAGASLSSKSVRLSGKLTQFKNKRLTTAFPQVLNTIQKNVQVTVVVEHPFHTANLETKSLYQVDARISPGTPDSWTYAATGADPAIDISVANSSPKLQVDQLIHCQQRQQKVTEVRHLMFWSTNSDGLFAGKFKLTPGYRVQEVTVFSENQTSTAPAWNIQTEKNRDYLFVHLPNQLVEGQRLAVSVVLRPRRFGKQQKRLTLPAIELVNGDLQKNRLLISNRTTIKSFPKEISLRKIPFSQLKPWSDFGEEFTQTSSDFWESQWVFKDISSATRVIIESNASQATQNELPTASPSTTDEKKTLQKNSRRMKQVFNEGFQWNCQGKILVYQNDLSQTQIQLQYTKTKNNEQPFSNILKFSESVTLHSVRVNDHFFSIEQPRDSFTIPAIKDPVNSVTLTYSVATKKTLLLPYNLTSISYQNVLLCLPQEIKPLATSEYLLLQKMTTPQPKNSEFDPAFLSNRLDVLQIDEKSTMFDSLLKSLVLKHSYSLYEARWFDVAGSSPGDIPFVLMPRSKSWLGLFWVFFVVFLFCLLLNVKYQVSPYFWLAISLLASFFAFSFADHQMLQFFFPAVVAVFIAAQLPGSYLNWLLMKISPAHGKVRQRSGSLRYLLTGTQTLLLFSVWINSSDSLGQPMTPEEKNEQEKLVDLLIPVKSSLLTTTFKGLKRANYPDVIYLPKKEAEQLREAENSRNIVPKILFQSARYDIQWTPQGKLQIHSIFEVIDTRKEQNKPITLPLTGIDSLPALQATVNGELIDMTPLPDDAGLEILLPEISLLTDQADGKGNSPKTKTSEGIPQQKKRKYIIELDLIPQQKILLQGIEFSLGIPSVTQCNATSVFPENINAKLIRTEQEPITLSSKNNSDSAYLGAVKQLRLMIETASEREVKNRSQKIEQFQSSIQAQIHPRYVAVQIHAKVKFAGNTERTLTWKLPPGMLFRSVHASPAIDYRRKSIARNETLLELNVPASNLEENTILIDLILPTATDNFSKNFSLPTLFEKESDFKNEQQWQIAMQAAVGFELSEIDFPSTLTSRISSDAFMKNWEEQETFSSQAVCYRIQKPGQLSVRLMKKVSEISVIAGHQFDSKRFQTQLHSQYQVDVIGSPVWAATFDLPEDWEATSLKLTSNGTTIPVRTMKKKGKFVVAFANFVEESFELNINWKQAGKKLPGVSFVTPPRLENTLYYKENLKVTSSDPRTHLLLAPKISSKTNSVPDSVQKWNSFLEFEGELPHDLPEVLMQFRKQEQPSEIPLNSAQSSPSHSEKQPSPASGKVKNVAALKVEMDHTIWEEKNVWLGETLIQLRPSDQKKQPSSLSVEIQIPEQTEILNLSHHENISLEVVDNSILITFLSSGETFDFSQTDFVVLQWKRGRSFSWFRSQLLPFPYSLNGDSVSWRLLSSRQHQRDISLSNQSWKTYLELLSGSKIEGETSDTKLKSFESSVSSFEQLLQQLSIPLQNQVLSAQHDLKECSWNQPLQNKMRPVLAAGVSLSAEEQPIDSITIPNHHFFVRIAILFLASFWAWGIWRVNCVQQPGIRRRHLALCSFLIVGLITVLMTN